MADIKVLLVDDDSASRERLAHYLETVANFQVSSYDNGPEALKELEANHQIYTAFLLDYVLPAPISGEQILEQARSKFPRLPVIVFTGRDPSGGVRALAKGAYRYMRQPINRAEMVNVVRNLAEQNYIYYEAAQNVRQMLGSDLCIAWQLDKSRRQFRVVAWDGELDQEFRRNVFLTFEDPATRDLFRTRSPVYLSDVQNPKTAPHYQFPDEAKKRGWTSLISIPLIREERVVGLIDSYQHKLHRFIDQEERSRWLKVILPAFANQAAGAIRNAELSNQLQALQGFSQILAGSFEEQTVIRQILSKGLELVGADMGWLLLVDMKSGKLVLKDGLGVPSVVIGHEREMGEGIDGWAAQQGEAVNVSDVSEDTRHKAVPGLDIKSEVAVPLRREEQTIGVLSAKSRFCGAFTDDDVNLLTSLAAQAAIAIERANLTRHLREVSHLALNGDFDALAEYIVEAVNALTGAQVILWLMSDREHERGQALRIVSHRGGIESDYFKSATTPIAPGTSITAQAFELGEPVVRQDILDDLEGPCFHNLEEAERQGWHSFMTVPMLTRNREPLGSLSLYSGEVGKFGEPETQLIWTFANQAAVALENVRREKNVVQLRLIGQTVAREIAGGLKPVVTKVADAARELTGADYAAVYPYDPQRQRYYDSESVVVSGMEEAFTVREKPRDKGLAAIIREIDELVVHDVEQGKLSQASSARAQESDIEAEELLSLIRGAHFVQRQDIKAFVGLSLKAGTRGQSTEGEQEVGLLYIDFCHPHFFAEEELDLIRVFGHQVSSAIQNARLLTDLQRQVKKLRAINRVGVELAGTLDEQMILDRVAGSVFETIDCSHCSVFCLEEDQLVVRAAKGRFESSVQLGRTFELGRGVAGWVAQTSKPALVLNTLKDKRFKSGWSGKQEPQSLVVVPIFLENQVYGVISTEQDRVAAFSEYDLQWLETLALQASQALRIARRYEQRVQDMSVLQEINEAILQRQPDEIFNLIAVKACQSFGADYSALRLVDETSQQLVSRASSGRGRRDPLPMDNSSFTGWVASTRQAAMCPSVRQAEAGGMPYLRWYDDIQSCMAAPLMVANRLIGTLYVESVRLHAFSEESQLDLLQAFADQAAIAIENARLYLDLARRIRELEALTKIGRTVSNLGIDQILDLVYETIGQMMDLRDAQVQFAFYNEAKDEVSFPLAVEQDDGKIIDLIRWSKREATYRALGEDEIVEQFRPRARREPPGLNEYVIRSQEPLLIVEDFEQRANEKGIRVWPTFGRLDRPTDSWLGVPMMVGGRVIGVISLRSLEQEHAFDQEHVQVLTAVANQAAVAIENARLYEHISQNLERRIRELEVLTEIGRTVSYLGIDEILDLVYDEMGRIIDLSDAQVQVSFYDETKDEVSFPLTVEQDDGVTIDVVRWSRREDPYRKPGEDEIVEQFRPRARREPPGLNEYVIRSQEPLLIVEDFEQRANEKGIRVWPTFGRLDRPTDSWLGVPMMVGGRVIGVISLRSLEQEHAFDQEHVQVLTAVANQAAVAIENARLYEHISQNLDRRIQELEVLTEIGRTVSDLGIDQILNSVYDKMGWIIDLSDAQVQFAFYDETKDEVSFPLAVERDTGMLIDRVRWGKREAPYRQPGEDGMVEQFRPRARRDPPGLSEYVIRSKQPLMIVEDFAQKAKELGIQIWPTFGRLDRPTDSWLGVPMIVRDRVTGVISLRSLEQEHAFDQDHVEVLRTVANQAAVAIENARLYADMEEQVEKRTEQVEAARKHLAEVEQVAIMNEVTAEFIHKMANLAGTIPVHVNLIGEMLHPDDQRDARMLHHLAAIGIDGRQLMEDIRKIREAAEPEDPEDVRITDLIENAIDSVQQLQPRIREHIVVKRNLADDIPVICVEKDRMLNTLVNVIKNGVEAMAEQPSGTLVVSAQRGQRSDMECVEIAISDTGIGIPEGDLPRLFDSLFTTKKETGLGFGLWSSKVFIGRLGGDIEVSSQEGKGSTFTIWIPVDRDAY